MENWIPTDDSHACDALLSSTLQSKSSGDTEVRMEIGNGGRLWSFRVLMNDELLPNEKIAVVGSCEQLGNWKHNACIILSKFEGSTLWQNNAVLPIGIKISYRYFVCAINDATETITVRRWETHLVPRSISEDEENDGKLEDIFGEHDGEYKVDRGWLSSETLLQFRFFKAPFTWKQRMKKRLVYVKVTPMNLKIPSSGDNSTHLGTPNSYQLEDSLSNDTHDTKENGMDNKSFAFNEVAVLQSEECEIFAQPQFGVKCGTDDLVIFHLTIGDFENTAYLIDLYAYNSKIPGDEPPTHLGYQYVLPNLLKRSEGHLEVPITCASKHRPLGMMQVGYLIVKPTLSLNLDMRVSYCRYWNHNWTGLDVGHRGSGTSFKANDTVIRENTITSLKNAAEHGADLVEFDVQLSKDLVPVVYHDFMIYVSLKSKNTAQEHDFLALPMRELTLDQLKNLKVYHTAEGRSRETRSFKDDDLVEHQPFPQLSDVLDAIDPHVGFNIEVKWSQRLEDGTMEEEFEHVVDRNLYIDCILDVVFRKAGQRCIVFSCFDSDICTMLRFKQNRYPVMFLTLGETKKYKKYMDPRGNSMEVAVLHAVAMEYLGIVAHTEDLLRDPTKFNFARNKGLVVFCWGDDNNCKDTIKLLKGMGLHAIIYDKMDVLTSKEVKQSVFLLQAKESHKELLKLQALEMGIKWPSN